MSENKTSLSDRSVTGRVLAAANGQKILDLDPRQICPDAGLQDRLDGADAEAFAALRKSIVLNGQDTPVGVRPAPASAGHSYPYEIVYGRRRLRAVREISEKEGNRLKVRAVIVEREAEEAIQLQLRENAHRENYTFAEKMMLAADLEQRGHDRASIEDTLNLGMTEVSRAISLRRILGRPLIEELGRAPTVGRDTWTRLARAIERDTSDLPPKRREEVLNERRMRARCATADGWDRSGGDARRAIHEAIARLEATAPAFEPTSFASEIAARMAPRRVEGRVVVDCDVGGHPEAWNIVDRALRRAQEEVRRKLSEAERARTDKGGSSA